MRSLFSICISLLYIAYTAVRVRAELSAARRGRLAVAGRDAAELSKDKRELAVLTSIEILVVFLYIIRFPLVETADLGFPVLLRAIGLGLGAAGVALIARASAALDGEYSSVVEFKQGHRLVTTGPYARIRHPIYAGLCLLNTGVPLASSNGVIAAIWILGLARILLRRIPREERELESRFGERWRDYRASTGLFLPPRRGRASLTAGDRMAGGSE